MKQFYTTSENNIKPVKVMYRGITTRAADRYFENRMNSYEFNWDENEIDIVEDERDVMLYQDFLISGMVQIKKHTKTFLNSIMNIVTTVVDDVNPGMVKTAIKKGGNQ